MANQQHMKNLITFCFIVSALTSAFAQQGHKPKSHISEDGKIYWNRALPVYLRIASSPDDAGTLLKSKKQAKYTNPLYLDTEGVNYIRTRHAVDAETMKLVSPQTEILMEVYADGKSPISTLTFSNSPKKLTNEKLYYGVGLLANFDAADQQSGVDQIYTQINNGDFKTFTKELTFATEGDYSIAYYSVDKVGNSEKIKEKKFTVDIQSPTTFHNINGLAKEYIIAKTSTMYFTSQDNLSGVAKTYYNFDDGEYKLYAGKNINFSSLDEGEHTLHYYSVDQVDNKESIKEFTFYFDKTAPIMAADVLGDRFIANDQIYFSGRTKLKLTAVDNKVGVKEIMYSVNKKPFSVYEQPFYLPSVSGVHSVRYYSVDNLSNKTQSHLTESGPEEFKHNVSKVYVDLTGPDISFSVVGKSVRSRDTLFISPTTKIKLKGIDPESGIQKVTYSVDNTKEETTFSKPFEIPSAGFHSISYYGYDNVNNRNVADFFLFSDHEKPSIFFNFSSAPYNQKEDLNVYATNVILYLAATDRHVGLSNIYYQINDSDFKTYAGAVKGFEKNKKYKLIIKAVDLLGNENLKSVEFFTGK